MSKRIGIYGGSFNPIHIGHIETANFLLDNEYLDEVRFLLNPCSPFKRNNLMPDAFYRAQIILHGIKDVTIKNCDRFAFDGTEMLDSIYNHVCYTVNTLKHILYENMFNATNNCDKFYLIIGADVFNDIKKFKNWQWLTSQKLVDLIVLPRGGYEIDEALLEEFKEIILPVDFSKFKPIELSSTYVREIIEKGNDKEMKKVLLPGSYEYITGGKFYGYPNENSNYENKPKTISKYRVFTKDECKKMLISGSNKGVIDYAYYKSSTENCFVIDYSRTSEKRIFDYSKQIFVANGHSFKNIDKIKPLTKRTYSSPAGESFQYNLIKYNTRMFETDDTIYAAIVYFRNTIDILLFNHDKFKYVFGGQYNGVSIRGISFVCDTYYVLYLGDGTNINIDISQLLTTKGSGLAITT